MILGRPIKFWIGIRAVLQIYEIDSPEQLDTHLSIVENRERVIFAKAAEQLGGKVGMVPTHNTNKED